MKKFNLSLKNVFIVIMLSSCLNFSPSQTLEGFQNQTCTQCDQTSNLQSPAPIFIDNLKAIGKNEILLHNPDRGFRGELYLTLGNLKAYPGHNDQAFSFLEQELERFQPEKIKLYQCYVYLSQYYNKDITPEAFQQLKEYLTLIEQSQVRILLRFAYDYSPSIRSGASTQQMLKHIQQIGQFIRTENTLFNNTVHAIQLGMIGLWGEGHSESRPLNLAKIIPEFFQQIPQNIFIQIRHPKFLKYIPKDQQKKVSLHDDFIVGISHPWGMIAFDHPQYSQMLYQNSFAPADGEMPWGRDKTVAPISPLKVLDQINQYQLTSLSIAHNYLEKVDNMGPFVLEKAKSVILDSNYMKSNNLPYNPKFLVDDKISMFEYLQYHLGYNLVLGNFKFEKSTPLSQASVVLFNFGLAPPHEFIIQVKVNNELQSLPALNIKHLGKNKSIELKINCKPGDQIALRLVHRRNPNLTIRLANDLEIIDGWHMFPHF